MDLDTIKKIKKMSVQSEHVNKFNTLKYTNRDYQSFVMKAKNDEKIEDKPTEAQDLLGTKKCSEEAKKYSYCNPNRRSKSSDNLDKELVDVSAKNPVDSLEDHPLSSNSKKSDSL